MSKVLETYNLIFYVFYNVIYFGNKICLSIFVFPVFCGEVHKQEKLIVVNILYCKAWSVFLILSYLITKRSIWTVLFINIWWCIYAKEQYYVKRMIYALFIDVRAHTRATFTPTHSSDMLTHSHAQVHILCMSHHNLNYIFKVHFTSFHPKNIPRSCAITYCIIALGYLQQIMCQITNICNAMYTYFHCSPVIITPHAYTRKYKTNT